jgi:catechol 2,3-dioxygenase-like lactoylglutathione lyase family enzyme
MTPAAPGMVVVIRVRDLTVSRRFYQALGFLEVSGDLASGTTACAALRYRECGLLLTESGPVPRGQRPLLLGLNVDDVDDVVGALRDGGFDVSISASQRPPGARASVPDPDGNTILIGQTVRYPAHDDGPAHVDGTTHSAMASRSLFAETAAQLAAETLTTRDCQVRDVDLRPCGQVAAVKLADSAGESLWACLDHADEILVTVRGAFIASHADPGVASFLARRRR